MIWGEFINQIRVLHSEFLDHFPIQPASFTADVELSSEFFPFPESTGEFGEWDPPAFPEKILEALEFHPVERVLLEGPLLPIQEVSLHHENWDQIFKAILRLEIEWMTKAKIHSEDKQLFIETTLRSKFLQLQRRSGGFGLKAV